MINQSLTELVMEQMRSEDLPNPNFPTCLFVAAGVNEKRGLERNVRKVLRLRDKICPSFHESVLRPLTFLDESSAFFGKLLLQEGVEEYRPQTILDGISSSKKMVAGSALGLVATFNLVACSAGITSMGAYSCKNGFYFSRYFGFARDDMKGLSFPIRSLVPAEHKELMHSATPIYNRDLVIAVAKKTACSFEQQQLPISADRFYQYAEFMESVSVSFL